MGLARLIVPLDPIARSTLPRPLYSWLLQRYASVTFSRLADRRYMEGQLLPAFASTSPKRVLSVGTRWYCAHYDRYFAKGNCEFWTIDTDAVAGDKYGSPGRHVIGSVVDADRYFPLASFDVVLLNGIFSWGVDTESDQIMTLTNLRTILRDRGILLIGWDEDLCKDRFVPMAEAAGFTYSNELGLPSRKRFTGNAHIYDLFTAAPAHR